MKAVKVIHMNSNKQVALSDDQPMPKLAGPTDVIMRTLCVGLDGTDKEIVNSSYGWPPEGKDELIFGHEAMGVVVESGEAAGLKPGDLVVPIVRRPCHDPACVNCRNGRQDYCQTAQYIERGIKGENGFLTEYAMDDERYFVRVPAESLTYGMMAEPQSIVEKVWDEVQYIQQRMIWEPKRVLVLGAGPLGLLAALTSRCLGLDVHVWSMDAADSLEGQIIREIGAAYQQAPAPSSAVAASAPAGNLQYPDSLTAYVRQQQLQFDLIYECTGFAPLAFEAMDVLGPNGVLAMLGLSSGDKKEEVNVNQLNMEMVLQNKCVIGSVNAARKHYETGLYRLQQMNEKFPAAFRKIITERISLEEVPKLDFRQVAIKTVVDVIPQEQWGQLAHNRVQAEYSFSV